MRIGVLLPTFRRGANDAFAFAAEAADAGLDGAFAYDHLWPMGSPQRPSLAPFPLLGVVATRYEDLFIGPLVARVGLVGTSHLVEQFMTLEALAPGRVIAALGTGDKLSAAENEAYGLRVLSPEERREMLRDTAQQLTSTMPVWIGAGGEQTNSLARGLGATINLWDASLDKVREFAALGSVNWAGPEPEDVVSLLDGLEEAGATWAVFSPQVEIVRLKEWRQARNLK